MVCDVCGVWCVEVCGVWVCGVCDAWCVCCLEVVCGGGMWSGRMGEIRANSR